MKRDLRKIFLEHPDEEPAMFEVPEKNLLVAVVVRAVADLLTCETKSFEESCEWFFEDDLMRPFSFRWTCQQLGVEADPLRDHLERLGAFSLERCNRPLWLRSRIGAFISR